MSFHKGTFKIRMNKVHGYEVKEVNGWIDESNIIGYNKKGKKEYWVGSDLVTGASIYSAKTRKEVYEYVKKNAEMISQARQIMIKRLKEEGIDILLEES